MSNKDMPAYPVEYDHQTFSPKTVDESRRLLSGMSMLEAFALAALQGFCANPAIIDRASDQAAGYTAKAAVDFAEAALAELEGRDG